VLSRCPNFNTPRDIAHSRPDALCVVEPEPAPNLRPQYLVLDSEVFVALQQFLFDMARHQRRRLDRSHLSRSSSDERIAGATILFGFLHEQAAQMRSPVPVVLNERKS
jgi:hypothetical protein